MRERKFYTESELIKRNNERNRYIINNIECDIRVYIYSLNIATFFIDIHGYTFSEKHKNFIPTQDPKTSELRKFSYNNDRLEIIKKDSKELGFYRIYHIKDNYINSISIEYIDGVDFFDLKDRKVHKKFIKNSLYSYNNLDYNKYDALLAIYSNSERYFSQKYSDHNYKEFQFKDKEYFNTLSKYKNKKFILIREMDGSSKYQIYKNCKIIDLDLLDSIIVIDVGDHFSLPNDLNIDPIKDYISKKRISKIKKIFS